MERYTVIEMPMPNIEYAVRSFSLCESCFWSATVFGDRVSVGSCPLCSGNRISIIPLTHDEEYRLRLISSSNLEMSFSKIKKVARQ